MDQTINEKYKGKILNFVQNAKSQTENAVTKVRDNFYIVIENGVRVLKQIVPTKLVESVERRCQEWGISHQVENVVEHQGEEVASISEVASAEL
jgi:hypothetical protein